MYPMYLIEMKRNYLAPRYPYFIDNQNIRTNMRLEVKNEGIDVSVLALPPSHTTRDIFGLCHRTLFFFSPNLTELTFGFIFL
jgi:hypothetical protein